MTLPPSLARARQEWRGNVRLRLGALVVVLIAGAHSILAVSDRQAALARDYARDVDLLARMESAAREKAWLDRARGAETRAAAMTGLIPRARSEGQAQADLQAWLTRLATEGRLDAPRVQVEPALDVPGYPELWQVMARLDANVPPHHLPPLLRDVSLALPWIRAETLEVTEAQPMRLTLVVRGYFLRAPRDAARDARVAAGKGAKTPVLAPAVYPLSGGPALPATGTAGGADAMPAFVSAGTGAPLPAAGGAPVSFASSRTQEARPGNAPAAPVRRERPQSTRRPPRLVSAERAAERAANGGTRSSEERRAAERERFRQRATERPRQGGSGEAP